MTAVSPHQNSTKQDKSNNTLVLDFIKGKTLSSFSDPLAFQKQVRSEWDARELQIRQIKSNSQNA